MQIEPATLEDLDAVVGLWVALARDQREYGSHVLGPESREHVERSFAEKIVEDRAFLAWVDSTVVGFVSVGMDEGPLALDVRRGVIENVFVRKPHRQRGVGTALIERAERELAARGADVVSLEVLARNDDARRLYRDLGYDVHRIEAEKRLGSDTD